MLPVVLRSVEDPMLMAGYLGHFQRGYERGGGDPMIPDTQNRAPGVCRPLHMESICDDVGQFVRIRCFQSNSARTSSLPHSQVRCLTHMKLEILSRQGEAKVDKWVDGGGGCSQPCVERKFNSNQKWAVPGIQ
jgi:hypothetical protein